MRNKNLRLNCFSPPVMLATFVFEVSMAIYTLWRYKLGPASRLSVLVLLTLAVFQLSEYMICEGGLGLEGLSWAKIGFVAITFLPPLGLHLVSVIGKSDKKLPLVLAYGSALVFSAYFLLAASGIESQVCGGNYVIFHISQALAIIYGVYYYGWLLFGIFACRQFYFVAKTAKIKRSMLALALGYISFLLPTTAVNLVDTSTMAGIPSIMCGFAVLLAAIISFVVLPLAGDKKS